VQFYFLWATVTQLMIVFVSMVIRDLFVGRVFLNHVNSDTYTILKAFTKNKLSLLVLSV
jgi:hypothetical protein